MKQAREGTGGQASQEGHQQGHPYVVAMEHHHDAHGTAGAHGAVYRQVRQVQDFKGDVDADGHDAPDKALGQSPWQGIEQVREKVHVTSSVSDEIPRDRPSRGKGGKGSVPFSALYGLVQWSGMCCGAISSPAQCSLPAG